jgi:hypothetical protein
MRRTSKGAPENRRKSGRILSDPAVAEGGAEALVLAANALETTECALSIPANEKRRPLAVVFYDAEKDKLNFDRSEDTTLEEFRAIMTRLFPRWLEQDFPKLLELTRKG